MFTFPPVGIQWTPNMQKQEGKYPRQSSAERKEALYNDIIDYFDKGKVCIFYMHSALFSALKHGDVLTVRSYYSFVCIVPLNT